MWSLASACNVICTPSDTVAFQCGQVQDCSTVPTVPNSNNNQIKVIMPAGMTDLGGPIIKHTLTVSGLNIPGFGFAWLPL